MKDMKLFPAYITKKHLTSRLRSTFAL